CSLPHRHRHSFPTRRSSDLQETNPFRSCCLARSWPPVARGGFDGGPPRAQQLPPDQELPETRCRAFPFCAWAGIVTEIHHLFPGLNVRPVNDAARLSSETVAPRDGCS